MKSREWQISIVLVSFILGLLLAVQFRTQANVEVTRTTTRVDELTTMLQNAEKERENLQEEVKELRDKMREYEKAATEGRSLLEAMRQELDKARMAAGLVEVTGPGVLVYLEDSILKAAPGEDPNLYLIHQEDLLQIVNELFAAGAEAISINGQRVVTTTEIRCAGPTILVNGTRIGSPYEISAIGESKTLESSLNMPGGVIEMLRTVGIKVMVTKKQKVVVPAFSGGFQFKYAKVVE